MSYEETKREVQEFLDKFAKPNVQQSLGTEGVAVENRTPIQPNLGLPLSEYRTPHILEEDRSHPHQFGLVAPSGAPQVRTLTEAQKWIDILWRYAVQDAERMNAISDRLDALELAQSQKPNRKRSA